jgi:hypothetical protein
VRHHTQGWQAWREDRLLVRKEVSHMKGMKMMKGDMKKAAKKKAAKKKAARKKGY